jgi:hypothetical protein
MGDYYHAIKAQYAMLPGPDMAYEDFPWSHWNRVTHQLITSGAVDVLMGGRKTHWIEIHPNGDLTLGNEPLRGADDDYLEYLETL